jgi:hypothetical protein
MAASGYAPVKLVMGLLGREESLPGAETALRRRFGKTDYESRLIPFAWTDYYLAEMGPELLRKFLSFRRLIQPDRLAAIKLWTNEFEEELAVDGRRTVNLDPGYVDLAKLVLATHKDNAHRLPIGRGVFAEITLRFRRNREFEPWEWTYPDYRTPAYLSVFDEIRRLFKAQIENAPG